MPERPGPGFRRAFARHELQALAGRRSFERGLCYAADGQVSKLTVTASSVKAKVRGSASYQVLLALDDDDEPTYGCTCPVGDEGRFCKHAVAVALVATDAATPPVGDGEEEDGDDLAGYLAGLDHESLVELILERAAEDDLYDARLRMAAARVTARAPRVGGLRNALDEAFAVGHGVDYREMYGYAAHIDSVLDLVQALLDDGHAAEVVELAEHAVDLAEDALGYVDDSDGWMSGIAERLGDLHLAACEALRPDPVPLARALFDRERSGGDLEVFYNVLSAYAEVLGPPGVQEYRRLAQEEWDALPPLGPNDEERSWSSRRFRITKIMETAAELSGDVDAVVEILARDQSHPHQFVRIAEVLRAAERYDDALAWAEQGLAMHGHTDSRLVDVIADEHHRAGRGEQAVQVVWEAYDAAPGLRTYVHLAEHAARAGRWQDRHEPALDLLRTRVTRRSSARSGPRPGPDTSTLVEVLLHDGDVEAAWAQASVAGCRRELWLELARRREAEHPLDAIGIWQEEAERCIDRKNNDGYAQGVQLIAHVGDLMGVAGRAADFAPYVDQVRARHKPKRNLMKLFAGRGW